MQKMQESAAQDLKIAIDELSNASLEAESVKLRLKTCQALAEKQAEEIAMLSKLKKRSRVLSYIELGVGASCLIVGNLPVWTAEQKNIKTAFISMGAVSFVAGSVLFAFTFTF